MTEILYYRSLYFYNKVEPIEISLNEHDILEIRKPFQFELKGTEKNPEGWLLGTNKTTGETGYFPGTLVEFVRSDIVQPPPTHVVPKRPVPRPPKSNKVGTSDIDGNDSGYVCSPGMFVPLNKSKWFLCSVEKCFGFYDGSIALQHIIANSINF